MKKIAILLVLALCLVMFAGCDASIERTEVADEGQSMFVLVESTPLWRVVYHRETKVMYAVSRGTYSQGIFTLLVNADGSPMLWEE